MIRGYLPSELSESIERYLYSRRPWLDRLHDMPTLFARYQLLKDQGSLRNQTSAAKFGIGHKIKFAPIQKNVLLFLKHATFGEIGTVLLLRRHSSIQKSLHPSNDTRTLPREMPRQRRKSSGLGAELPGDTGASALSTLEPTPTFNSPPLTPVCTQP